MTLHVQGVSKRFTAIQAVSDLTFRIPEGRICGLLGSNGAGKTTTMRMIMQVFLPDQGSITWKGAPVTDELRRRFGYLPEERGLYPKMKVREQLIYLTELKGPTRTEAARRADLWLERLEASEYANRPVEQLSKGNQQKIQFAAAVAAGPSLCILDEPFTGLDPVNTLVLESALRSLVAEGTTILFSSHNMDQVEALCEDVVLLHRSRLILSGGLREIKRLSRRQSVRFRLDSGRYDFLDTIPGATVRLSESGTVEVSLPDGLDPNVLLRNAADHGTVVEYSLGEPSLREIYLEKVGAANA